MSYHEALAEHAIAISISESPDMAVLGLSDEHLRDAMAEIARHMLALGARLLYGGDLRQFGFSKLLYELVARHRRDADDGDDRTGVVSYLAWPVHITHGSTELAQIASDLSGIAELVCLALDGSRMSMAERELLLPQQPKPPEWSTGLSAMRRKMLSESHARIVLGGRIDNYKGSMPGIAEESLLSLKAREPLFLIGGFGGCARDIALSLGVLSPLASASKAWPGRADFDSFTATDLNNGLTLKENEDLARTPHIDQAIILIVRGLLRLTGSGRSP
jgi:hypothetical protein